MIQFAGDAAAAPDASTPDPTREPPTDPGLAARMAALAATERLGDEIAELSAHIHAATYRLLELLRDFDAREGWSCGFRSCAHWLSWRTGISLGAAREKVRVARALGSLPLISAGMQRGALSYSKGRALTRVATAENEGKLMEFALTATASHVERMVRAWRRVDRWEEADEERARHESRYLTLYPDEDGMYVVRGRLDPEVGALLEQALEAAKEQLYGKVPSAVTAESASSSATPGIAATYGQRRADALGLVAEQALAMETAVDADATGADIAPDVSAGTSSSGLPAHAGRRTPRRADRFQVVLHVDEAALREADDDASGGDASTEGQGDAPPDAHSVFAQSGHRVPAETSRRLSCDASLVEMRHDAEGNVLDVGRKRRTVPPSIRRALEHRDRGRCRFPTTRLRRAVPARTGTRRPITSHTGRTTVRRSSII